MLTLSLLVATAVQTPVPTIDFWRFLDVEFRQGTFLVGTQVVAFPKAGSSYEYVFQKDGQPHASVKMLEQPITKYTNFCGVTPEGSPIVKISEAGEYTYSLLADGAPLRTVKFSVKKATSTDPLSPGSTLTVTGPWATYMGLFSDAARPTDALECSYWTYPGERLSASTCKVNLTLSRGGKVVAQIRPYTLSGDFWKLGSLPLWKPDNRSFFTKADLVATDGDFIVTLSHDDKPIRTFGGSVAQKQLKLIPQAATASRTDTEVLLPRNMRFPGSSLHRAVLWETYWMKIK